MSQLAVALFAGLLLGSAFFGGLWITVVNSLRSPKAGVWFMLSNLVRTGFALTGFFFMAKAGWPELSACMVGFLCARFVVGRLVAIPTPHPAATGPTKAERIHHPEPSEERT